MSSNPTRTFPPSAAAAATIIHWSRLMAMTPHVHPSGTTLDMWARFLAVAWIPPRTPWMSENWTGSEMTPMSISGSTDSTWPTSKHSHSGFTPASFIRSSRKMMSSKSFSKTKLNTKPFRFGEYFA